MPPRDDPRTRHPGLRTASILLALIACTAAPPHSIDEPDAPAAYADAICDAIAACGCLVDPWPQCAATLTGGFTDWQRDALADGLHYDRECLQLLVAAMHEAPCDDPSPPCQIYFGDDPAGAPCERYGSSDRISTCAQGLSCGLLSGLCVAPDAPVTSLAVGARCLDDAARSLGACDRANAEFCDIEQPAPVCAPQASAGDPCSYDAACVGGHRCDAGICRAQHSAGAACTRRDDCTDYTCTHDKCSVPLEVPFSCIPLVL